VVFLQLIYAPSVLCKSFYVRFFADPIPSALTVVSDTYGAGIRLQSVTVFPSRCLREF
jgi:hypothetical protein